MKWQTRPPKMGLPAAPTSEHVAGAGRHGPNTAKSEFEIIIHT